MMVKKEGLHPEYLENTYKFFNEKPFTHKNAEYFRQKKVEDENGTKYFINVIYYKAIPELIEEESYEITIQFQNTDIDGKKITVNTNFFGIKKDTTDKTKVLKEIEKKIDDIWLALGKPYYEENIN